MIANYKQQPPHFAIFLGVKLAMFQTTSLEGKTAHLYMQYIQTFHS